jgi:hypothetical protein
MVAAIPRFLTGGPGGMTPRQKAQVAEMEKDYEHWSREKRTGAGSANNL